MKEIITGVERLRERERETVWKERRREVTMEGCLGGARHETRFR